MAGQRCTTCIHPQRAEIERRLLAGDTLRSLSEEFGVGLMAIKRHKDAHLRPELVAAFQQEREVGDTDRVGGLLGELRDLHRRAISLLERAEAAGDYRTAISGIGQATRVLEVVGRLLGDISDGPTTINVTLSPQFIQVRQVLLGALERHPAARQDVLAALEGVR